MSTRDHGSVGYRVPVEWASLSDSQRGTGSLGRFKRESRDGFLAGYGAFVCAVRDCYVCRAELGQGGHNVGADEGEGDGV